MKTPWPRVAFALALLFSALTMQSIGLLHGVAHPHHGPAASRVSMDASIGSSADAQVASDSAHHASGWLQALFADHFEGSAGCTLFDQLTHADLLHELPVLALAFEAPFHPNRRPCSVAPRHASHGLPRPRTAHRRLSVARPGHRPGSRAPCHLHTHAAVRDGRRRPSCCSRIGALDHGGRVPVAACLESIHHVSTLSSSAQRSGAGLESGLRHGHSPVRPGANPCPMRPRPRPPRLRPRARLTPSVITGNPAGEPADCCTRVGAVRRRAGAATRQFLGRHTQRPARSVVNLFRPERPTGR